MRGAGIALLAMGAFGALTLAGCGNGEEKDLGKEITSSADVPKVDAEAEIAKINANEHMPPAAKTAAIANLRRGEVQGAVKSGGK